MRKSVAKELLADQDKSIVTRDLSIIFSKMEGNWNKPGLSPDEWNYMGLLIGFRYQAEWYLALVDYTAALHSTQIMQMPTLAAATFSTAP